MQNGGKFKRLKHPEVAKIHLTFLNIPVCRLHCLKYLAYLMCRKFIHTQKLWVSQLADPRAFSLH